MSWHHTAHDVLSAPVLAAVVVAPLVLALRFRADPRWRPLAPVSVGAAAAAAIPFTLGGLETIRGWEGALQRAGASAALLWLEATALRLLWLSRATS